MNEEMQALEVTIEGAEYVVELGIRGLVALKNIAALIFYKTSNWHNKRKDEKLVNKKGNTKQKTMNKITNDVSFLTVGKDDLKFFEENCKRLNVPYTALTELKDGKEYVHVMFPTAKAAQVHEIEKMIQNRHIALDKENKKSLCKKETIEEFIKDTGADKPDWLKKNFPDIDKEVEKIKKKENVKVPDKDIKEMKLAMYRKMKTNNLSNQMKRNDFSTISCSLKDCVGMKRNENKEIMSISFLLDKKHSIEVSTDKVMFQDGKFHIVIGNDERVKMTNISNDKAKNYLFKDIAEAKKKDSLSKLKGEKIDDTTIKEDKTDQDKVQDKESFAEKEQISDTILKEQEISPEEMQAFFFSPENEKNRTVIEKGVTGKDEKMTPITINEGLIVKEKSGTIQTRVPKTWGDDVRYLLLKEGMYEKIHHGKTVLAHLSKDKIYNLYDKNGQVASTITGKKIYQYYDKVAQESRNMNASKNNNKSMTKKNTSHTTKTQERNPVQNRQVRR